MDWGRSAIEKLRQLADEGLSARQIAIEIPGATRSAVISKMRRSNIEFKNKRGTRDTVAPLVDTEVAETEPAPPPPEPTLDPVAEPSADPVSTLDLQRGHCKWPLNGGEAPGWLHCGARATRGPYCESHDAKAFSKPHPRRVA